MEQQRINITLDKTQEVKCEHCDNNVFLPGFMLRKASKFLTGGTQDSLIPIEMMVCSKCGGVNQDLIPPVLRNEYLEFEEVANEEGETPSNVVQMPIPNAE